MIGVAIFLFTNTQSAKRCHGINIPQWLAAAIRRRSNLHFDAWDCHVITLRIYFPPSRHIFPADDKDPRKLICFFRRVLYSKTNEEGLDDASYKTERAERTRNTRNNAPTTVESSFGKKIRSNTASITIEPVTNLFDRYRLEQSSARINYSADLSTFDGYTIVASSSLV